MTRAGKQIGKLRETGKTERLDGGYPRKKTNIKPGKAKSEVQEREEQLQRKKEELAVNYLEGLLHLFRNRVPGSW
jgi:hypothetical protein